MPRWPGETLQEEINRVSESGGGKVYLLSMDKIVDTVVIKRGVSLVLGYPGRTEISDGRFITDSSCD